jgi:hypothetical protein
MANIQSMLGSIFADPRIAERKQAEKKRNARDRYHAKKLAAELGIDLTIETNPDWGCWIEYHVDQVGPQGWEDELFSRSWGEVRDKLEEIKADRSK